jgi:alpha-tubulin suppressor-like RCC1 family protein
VTTPGQATPMVAAGALHSLALKSNGTVWAWGNNGNGQLGNGTYTNSSTPVQVYGLTNVKRIAAGGRLSLAVKTDGTVWAWGYNLYGLGNGMTQSYYVFQVSSLTDIQEIIVGTADAGSTNSYSCYVIALKTDGTVWGWGYNADGELGDGTTVNKTTPVQVKNLTGVTAISTWCNHILTLKNDGTVWAWGANGSGQLGNGNTTTFSVPVQVYWITDVVSISAGTNFSIAKKSDGTVWVWGGNQNGDFGNGNTNGSLIPTQSYNLESYTSFTSGYWCSHGLTSSGSGWSWGYNYWGGLGDGTSYYNGTSGVYKNIPVQISGLSEITCFSAGLNFTLAVKSDGTVWGWGYNGSGQLGDGSVTSRYSPVQVSGLNLN